MKALLHAPTQRLQQGVVSVIALLFLVSVVVFILMQSLSRSGSKALESQQYFDSVAALALAESGRELAVASIANAVNANDTQFLTSCNSYASSSPIAMGRGTFQYSPSTTAPSSSLCPVRVTGTVGQAHRTLESKINLSYQVGTGGYGTDVNMALNNTDSKPAVAVFNLAWRRQGSTGASPSGGQAVASACILPECGMQWNLESSSGLPSVGSLGTSLGVAANASVPVHQTLNSARNYVEVGLILVGKVTQPQFKGNYSSNKETTNTQNIEFSRGTTPNNWCANDADTLVFGVSGRGDDNPSAEFSSVEFDRLGTQAQRIPMGKPGEYKWTAHYPNTDGSSPNTFGDVFSEIWYIHNPYVLMTNASSSGTTITVDSTVGLSADTYIKVNTSDGIVRLKVKSVDNDNKTFTVYTAAPPFNGATVYGGISALFSSSETKTTFELRRANAAAQQWAGGFVCYSGVDPSKVRRVSSSQLRVQQWHEVLNGE